MPVVRNAFLALVFAVLPLALLPSCAGTGMGSAVDVIFGPGATLGGDVFTVRSLDTRRQRLDLEDRRGSRIHVEYDRRTRVVYQNREYAVSVLQRGDLATMRLQSDGRNRYYTDRIHLRERAADRGAVHGRARVQRIGGTVGRIDRRHGAFEVHDGRRRTVVATLPYRADRDTENRFRRLRTGQRVLVEGRMISQQRIEVQRIR